MAIEQLRPEILAIEQTLVAVYRAAQSMIDAELSALVNNPMAFRQVSRLRALRERITLLLRQVDVQAASWVDANLPAIYRMGQVDAAPIDFSLIPTAAVSRLQLDTLRPLLTATTHVGNDVKRLLDRASRDVALEKVLGLDDLSGATKRMTELVVDVAPSAITYANGAQMPLESYVAMVVRTRTGIAYNQGMLDRTRSLGTGFVECLDGPGCGWSDHDDPDLANGKIVTVDEAADNVLAHPNCRRAFSPRPDVTDPNDAEPIRPTGLALSAP